ncbi:HlyD family efflux transporter periplasmic adaptor subunit [Psychrobium sp. MM17-31]|uniref:efflux RND transporter periplasmic adaptor subunit n=1 Tax=Psychrobium sp. MM17-31 TaxID=2917758 RepID=UPI001EF3E5DB|nr:HlyD family efflux transporter periplasmic adaptor subunit [Psychrobium sp. MM17-31]MCG7530052.1 HlyD family efflux transporter periplasmic adaptor subunit [Psychrobium sp. MM17-31]
MRDTSGQDVVLKPRSKRGRTLAVAGVAVLLSATAVGFAAPQFNELFSSDMSISSEQLRYGVVTRGDLQRDIAVQGQVVAANSPTLYSPSSGNVSLHVKAGDRVTKDQLLLQIDSPVLTNRLDQEQASLEELKLAVERQQIHNKTTLLNAQQSIELAAVNLELQSKNMSRAKQSMKHQVISREEFEQNQAELKKTQLAYTHAKQGLVLQKESLAFELKTKELQLERQQFVVDDLKRQIDELTLRSPLDGIIGLVNIREKDLVAINAPLITVVDLSDFEVEVNIPENYADDLGVGLPTEISLNGQEHRGELTAISPEVNNGQVVGRMRFVDGSPSGLRQNQRINARVLIETRTNVLKVRRGQFIETGGGRIAYVVNNNSANKTNIVVGARSLSEVEIVSGLREGDRVVISSTDAFNGNQSVFIAN